MSKRISGLFFVITVLVTVFIFSRSMKSAVESREESAFFANIVLAFFHIDPDIIIPILRKSAHFIEFFLQGGCLSAAIICLGKYYQRLIYVLFVGLFTAVLDEFLQLYVEGRGSMVSDVLIDFSGTCAAVVIFSVIYYLLKGNHGIKYCKDMVNGDEGAK